MLIFPPDSKFRSVTVPYIEFCWKKENKPDAKLLEHWGVWLGFGLQD